LLEPHLEARYAFNLVLAHTSGVIHMRAHPTRWTFRDTRPIKSGGWSMLCNQPRRRLWRGQPRLGP
jgi:hypothetical protein